ncbi:methyl-accepting chemotaxis protein [Anaeromicropila herbilytica]|uniref:Methyl-accepting chemotaxis protein n=1 Tax=Anaeromicropila herbilytica TaxID=2785025 RepID=A0A7R7ICS4_9FIRM|nr:methyl-accepting chemotaxis protein [Anaeromicropila herbilytica]BCN31053.1 methyl-accepting chemotaxis protein [Anaeromicropila herbilytica]
MERKLESFLDVIPELKNILQEDVALVLTDRNNIIYYDGGNILNLPVKVGDELSHDDPMYQVIQKGEVVSAVVPKEFLGIPFKFIGYPIKDSNGNVIGSIGIDKSIDQQSKVEESVTNLSNSLSETNASVEEIAIHSQKLLESMNSIVNSTKETEQKIKETDNMLNLIKNVSSQSNLLALNAAIEAARAGEAGKGFSVVANEMRKLSQMSDESAKTISNLLLEMQSSINKIVKEIKNASALSESQASSTEYIAATLEEISVSSENLVQAARIK